MGLDSHDTRFHQVFQKVCNKDPKQGSHWISTKLSNLANRNH